VSTTSRINLTRIGFIPTNGLDRESHQCEAKEENLLTSFGLELLLIFRVVIVGVFVADVLTDPLTSLSLDAKEANFRPYLLPNKASVLRM